MGGTLFAFAKKYMVIQFFKDKWDEIMHLLDQSAIFLMHDLHTGT